MRGSHGGVARPNREGCPPPANARPRRPAAGVLTLLLLAGAVSPAAWSMSGHEHVAVGNDGLAVALAHVRHSGGYLCPDSGKLRCIDAELLAKLEEMLPGERDVSYGQMVAAVDHVVNPVKFMEREGEVGCFPGDLDELYTRHIVGYSQLLAWRASHVNEMHFQSEGLASLWYWHFAAVKSATVGECLPRPDMALDQIPDDEQDVNTLVGALVVNAISEHFLHDFFAPGHVFTFRDTMGDYSSLSNHDRYNRLGAVLLVQPSRWRNELKPLLTGEGIAALAHLTPETVEAAVASIEENYTIDLWGDRNLWRSDAQRLLMSLISARSVLDVIDGYVTGQPYNHLGSYEWRQMSIEDGHLVLPRAAIPYGAYAEHRRKNKALFRGTTVHLSLSGQGFVESGEESSFVGLTDLELSTGFRAPGRKPRTGGIAPRIYQWDVAAGYSWLDGGTYRASGPSGRFIFAIPSIDMKFSADAAYRNLEGEGVETRKLATALRWEMGFALAALHLAFGRDYFITSAGTVEGSPTVRYGVTFSLPTTRIPGLRNLADWRLRRKRPKFLSRFDVPPAQERGIEAGD